MDREIDKISVCKTYPFNLSGVDILDVSDKFHFDIENIWNLWIFGFIAMPLECFKIPVDQISINCKLHIVKRLRMISFIPYEPQNHNQVQTFGGVCFHCPQCISFLVIRYIAKHALFPVKGSLYCFVECENKSKGIVYNGKWHGITRRKRNSRIKVYWIHKFDHFFCALQTYCTQNYKKKKNIHKIHFMRAEYFVTKTTVNWGRIYSFWKNKQIICDCIWTRSMTNTYTCIWDNWSHWTSIFGEHIIDVDAASLAINTHSPFAYSHT